MHGILNIALRAAREASDLIVQAVDRLDRVKIFAKGKNDFVTNIDREVESLLIEMIRKAYPDHGFLAEESGIQEGKDKESLWIIDPIDGTRNFMRGFPHFCISMACVKNNKLQHAVIVDPVRRDEFTATRGEGAQLNGKKIRCDNNASLENSVVSFSFSGDRYDDALALQKALKDRVAGLRFTGSAALDLAYTACGRLNAGWMSGIQQWDVAAGILLLQESGGLISDHQGNPDCLDSDRLVFANSKTFKPLLQIINKQA